MCAVVLSSSMNRAQIDIELKCYRLEDTILEILNKTYFFIYFFNISPSIRQTIHEIRAENKIRR